MIMKLCLIIYKQIIKKLFLNGQKIIEEIDDDPVENGEEE